MSTVVGRLIEWSARIWQKSTIAVVNINKFITFCWSKRLFYVLSNKTWHICCYLVISINDFHILYGDPTLHINSCLLSSIIRGYFIIQSFTHSYFSYPHLHLRSAHTVGDNRMRHITLFSIDNNNNNNNVYSIKHH